LELLAGLALVNEVVQAAPGRFQFLEVLVVHDLVELGRHFLVDLADPVLDVGLGVLGDDLAGLDGTFEELLEVGLGPVGLLVVLGPAGLDDLVEQARGFGRGRGCGAGRGGLFGWTHFASSVLAAGASTPSSFARAAALSVLLSTSASSCSSLSLPSILLSSCVRRRRMSSSSLSGPICSATRAGSKSSMCLKFSSTASLL